MESFKRALDIIEDMSVPLQTPQKNTIDRYFQRLNQWAKGRLISEIETIGKFMHSYAEVITSYADYARHDIVYIKKLYIVAVRAEGLSTDCSWEKALDQGKEVSNEDFETAVGFVNKFVYK